MQGELLVTATAGTVKSWTAERLKLEAQGDGLMFSRRNRSYSSGSTALALAAAIAAADNASSSSNATAPSTPNRSGRLDRAAAAEAAAAAAGAPLDEDSMAPTIGSHLTDGVTQQNGLAGMVVEASMSTFADPAVSDTAASTPVPAACKAANPMSVDNARARGLHVDAAGKVVVPKQPAQHTSVFPYSVMPPTVYPQLRPIGADYPGQVGG